MTNTQLIIEQFRKSLSIFGRRCNDRDDEGTILLTEWLTAKGADHHFIDLFTQVVPVDHGVISTTSYNLCNLYDAKSIIEESSATDWGLCFPAIDHDRIVVGDEHCSVKYIIPITPDFCVVPTLTGSSWDVKEWKDGKQSDFAWSREFNLYAMFAQAFTDIKYFSQAILGEGYDETEVPELARELAALSGNPMGRI